MHICMCLCHFSCSPLLTHTHTLIFCHSGLGNGNGVRVRPRIYIYAALIDLLALTDESTTPTPTRLSSPSVSSRICLIRDPSPRSLRHPVDLICASDASSVSHLHNFYKEKKNTNYNQSNSPFSKLPGITKSHNTYYRSEASASITIVLMHLNLYACPLTVSLGDRYV